MQEVQQNTPLPLSSGLTPLWPWLERVARFGYFCKGLMYFAVAVLVLRSLILERYGAADPRGVIEQLGRTPLSDAVLWILALGLLGYALWQTLRALLDPDGQGRGPRGLLKRSGYLLSAGVYAGFALAAAQRALVDRPVWSGSAEEDWTEALFGVPLGRTLVFGLGLGFFAVATNQVYIAYGARFLKRLSFAGTSARRRATLTAVGRLGILARGVVAGVIGWFFVKAAWDFDPQYAGGLSEAMYAFQGGPFGRLAQLLVVLGTAVYGLYAWVQARYRRISLEPDSPPAPTAPSPSSVASS